VLAEADSETAGAYGSGLTDRAIAIPLRNDKSMAARPDRGNEDRPHLPQCIQVHRRGAQESERPSKEKAGSVQRNLLTKTNPFFLPWRLLAIRGWVGVAVSHLKAAGDPSGAARWGEGASLSLLFNAPLCLAFGTRYRGFPQEGADSYREGYRILTIGLRDNSIAASRREGATIRSH